VNRGNCVGNHARGGRGGRQTDGRDCTGGGLARHRTTQFARPLLHPPAPMIGTV